MKYGSVNYMLAYLDADQIARRQARACKKFLCRIKNKAIRTFCKALKHEMVDDPECHEFNIPKKVCYLMKIGAREYRFLRYKALRLI